VQKNTSNDQKSTKVQKLTRFKRVSSLKRDSSRANSPQARFQPDPEFKSTRLKRVTRLKHVLSRANSPQARFKRVKRIRDTWSSAIGAAWIAGNSLQASLASFKRVSPETAHINSFLSLSLVCFSMFYSFFGF